MAAINFTPISLYYSTTAAAVPSAGNLVSGELAINITDEKLYFKNAAGTVKLLASNATSTPVLSFSAGTTGFTPNTATTGAITLAGTLATTNGGTGLTAFTSGTAIFASSTSALSSGTLPTTGGGTGLTTFTSGGAVYATSTSALTTGTLPVASGGTGLTSGTSGGILAFTATGTLASSGALTQYGIVYGGGAGAAPASTAVGTAGQVLTSNGAGVAPTFQTASGGITTGKSIAMAIIFGF
jgi:hypothetical protein